MEEMPLSALFEEARKIHLAASESRADQVGKLLPIIRIRLGFFYLLIICETDSSESRVLLNRRRFVC